MQRGGSDVKDLKLLVFLTQLGLSVAVPLGGFTLLAVWLHKSHGWGGWVIAAGVILGLIVAADGLRTTLKAMKQMSQKKKDEFVSFNDHE